MDDFEDDGASFRVRRARQLAGMVLDGELYSRKGVLIRRPVPPIARYWLRAWRITALAFVGVLVFCIVDFVLWRLGLPV